MASKVSGPWSVDRHVLVRPGSGGSMTICRGASENDRIHSVRLVYSPQYWRQHRVCKERSPLALRLVEQPPV